MRHLDVPSHMKRSEFLSALNAVGEADGMRCLIAIDALNEGNGRAIWPDRLAGLLHDVEEFPNLAIVVSCRTT